eukprot:scaffold13419_cov129-Isochrysis_galbana.AAC.2
MACEGGRHAWCRARSRVRVALVGQHVLPTMSSMRASAVPSRKTGSVLLNRATTAPHEAPVGSALSASINCLCAT